VRTIRGTIRSGAVAAALALAVAGMASAGAATDGAGAPRASHAFSEHWEGVWRLTGTPRGVIRFTQEGRTITARYTSGGGGNMTGQARGFDGEIITGRYKDDCCATRRGKFYAKLSTDLDSFSGTFDPTFSLSTYKWGGFKLNR
jgi:hypothetical protein